MDKPRCWRCWNALALPFFAEVEIDGHMRRVHKSCAPIALEEWKNRHRWTGIRDYPGKKPAAP